MGANWTEAGMRVAGLLPEFEQLLELPAGSVKETDALADMARWDSMAVLVFMAWADQKHSVVVGASEIGAAKTVGDLLNLI
jgi:hypothetical protein